jgi:hypothetical protein
MLILWPKLNEQIWLRGLNQIADPLMIPANKKILQDVAAQTPARHREILAGPALEKHHVAAVDYPGSVL